MSLVRLRDTPPWDWPPNAGQMLLDVLRDDRTSEADLELAAQLAGDLTVINEELVDALLAILRSGDRSETVRGQAAISLGPVLEDADTAAGFDDDAELPIAKRTVAVIRESLRTLYMDAGIPAGVRRRILEASVRAPEDWHPGAIRAAYASDDQAWRLTAVFCMRFVRGFDAQIVEALDSVHPDIRHEAVGAAGTWAIDAAWPHVAAILTSTETDKPLLLEAIDAAASIRPQEAVVLFDELTDRDDEDVADAIEDALAMAGIVDELDDLKDDDDGDDETFR